jgi:hypothetical protein
MVAMKWEDRLARVPMPEEGLVEGLAQAIYDTHRRGASPTWANSSEGHRDWSRAQARAALAYLRAIPGLSR